jgi:5'-deoxynucleotidase YfbR-like HD superfamily hydrolase
MDRIKALREAGQIQRVHTVPSHGSYSNAEHVAQMMNLLFELYPGDPPMELVKAVLYHDVAERWTGDIPGPMKYVSERLDDECTIAEIKCLNALCIDLDISENDSTWLRAIDKIELWLWAQDQLALGNQNASEIYLTLNTLFRNGGIPLPDECSKFVDEYRWSRLSDMPPTGDE